VWFWFALSLTIGQLSASFFCVIAGYSYTDRGSIFEGEPFQPSCSRPIACAAISVEADLVNVSSAVVFSVGVLQWGSDLLADFPLVV
jgi:hypothetical protein